MKRGQGVDLAFVEPLVFEFDVFDGQLPVLMVGKLVDHMEPGVLDVLVLPNADETDVTVTHPRHLKKNIHYPPRRQI